MTTKTLKKPVARPVAPPKARSAARRRERFAYWLIAPALAFMVLVHLIPTAAGSFSRSASPPTSRGPPFVVTSDPPEPGPSRSR